ncbi:DUF4178 domain-containing protein [Dactylosporangium siamense]|uniref:DUF4178 domain-containing protein n=1 Tax=Dactylosporangium siamense TaxID=685454 RepID=A0A919PM60_9ACTN|nr:DUF4178 domain-containing protein [Dactylosporangium siamense]GIG44613.1 hypothetical protein Dsi01nite_026540 [Dactylosporangium siamense]
MTALLVVLVVVLLAAVAVLTAVLLRRRRPPQGPAKAQDPFRDTDADVLRGDPRSLAAGDTVEIKGQAYTVRGSLHYTEQSWGWAEHLLDDAAGGPKVWLSVEEDPDLELALWHEVPSATVSPGAATVDFDGRRYTRDESGTARFASTGTTGLHAAGTAKYVDYAAADGALLSFESYAGPGEADRWEVGRGEPLRRAEVRVWSRGS